MKITVAQKARLKALLALSAKKITTQEREELKGLTDAATACGFDYDNEDPTPDEDFEAKSVTTDELTKTVGDAVSAAFKSAGASAETVTKAVTEAMKSVKPDGDAITKAVSEALKNHKPGMDAEGIKTLVLEIAKSIPSPSRMEHSGLDIELPVSHRAGNLTVAAKQLLNICLNPGFSGNEKARAAMANEGITPDQLSRAARQGDTYVKSIRDSFRSKTLTAGSAGHGLELVPTDLSSELQLRLYLESRIAGEFVGQEIDMPSDPFKMPLLTTRTTFKKGSEGGAPTESSPGTAAPTLTSAKLIGLANFSYEADEDSIVPILPMMTQQLAAGAAEALEDAIVNGDADGTHMDSDTEAVSLHAAKLFNGLRRAALAHSATKTVLSGGITSANIASIRKLLKKYGLKPKDLLILVGTNGYNDCVTLAETLTAEKMGNPQAARIITGEAPTLYGMNIIPSSMIRENLNASGVYDGVTETKGSVLIVHRPSWMVGVRRQFLVEVYQDKVNQLNQVVASFRRAFIALETTSATVPNVAIGYNYTA